MTCGLNCNDLQSCNSNVPFLYVSGVHFFSHSYKLNVCLEGDKLFSSRLGVFNGLGPHFELLSSPFLEGLCKGRAKNGLYYN